MDDTQQYRRPNRLWKWTRRVITVLFLLILIWAIVTVIWAKIASNRGEQMFENAMAELSRRGLAVNPQTIRKQHGIDEETWQHFQAAHATIRGCYQDFPGLDQLGMGGRDIPFGEHIEPKIRQMLEEFAAEYGLAFKLSEGVVAHIESLTPERTTVTSVDIPPDDWFLIRHLSRPWFMLSWLGQTNGDGDAALNACRNGLKLSRVADGHPSIVMGLLRTSTANNCVSTTEQALSRTTPSSQALRSLRNAMLAEDDLLSLQRMLEGDLSLWAEQASNPDLTMAENTQTTIRSYQMAVWCISDMREHFQDEPGGSQISESVIEDMGLDKVESLCPSKLRFFLGVSWLWHWLGPDSVKTLSCRRILRGLEEYDALKAPSQEVAKQAVTEEKLYDRGEGLLSSLTVLTKLEGKAALRVGATALAIEDYRAQHGDWPKDLSALNTNLRPDPFTGKSLIYRHNADGCIVYSVGKNLIDDGGEPDTAESDYDIVFRLLNTKNRNR